MRVVFQLGVRLAVWVAAWSVSAAHGNVIAYVDAGGDLVVLGDERSNHFIVCSEAGCSHGAPEDAVWVYTFDPSTTVNGLPGYPGVWFIPTSNRMRVRGNGGADEIECHPRYRDSLELDAGPGNDVLGLEGQFGELRLLMGPGDDHIGGDIETSGDFFVDAGDGADGLFLTDSNLALETGSCRVEMGPGNDRLYLREYVDCYGRLAVEMGAGFDELLCRYEIRFRDGLALGTGSDDDTVTLDGVSVTGRFDVGTGPGDDFLSLTSTLAMGRARFHGGSGLDELLDLGENTFPGGAPKVLGFEVVPDWLEVGTFWGVTIGSTGLISSPPPSRRSTSSSYLGRPAATPQDPAR